MKSILLPLMLASFAVLTSAADTPSVSGKWQIHNSIAGNESDVNCTFTQSGNDVAGTCAGDKVTGKVDGLKINWTYDTEYNGGPLTLKYSGSLDSAGHTITGTVMVEQYSVDGDFKATLATE